MTRPDAFGGGEFGEAFGTPAANAATVLPLVLLVDVSNSMNLDDGAGGPRIRLIVEALNRLLSQLSEIGDARRGGEVAMITFGNGGVRRTGLHRPGTPAPLGAFTDLADAHVPPLTAALATPLAEALEAAADLVEARNRQLAGQLRYRANVWLFTDGENTDEEGYSVELPQTSIDRLRRLEDERKLLLFACALPGANQAELRRIAPSSTVPIRAVDFKRIVNLIVVSSDAVGRNADASAQDIFRGLEDEFSRFESGAWP
jgi:uncharacterized protein YegL